MCRLQNICISTTTTTVSCLVSMAKVTFVLLEAISLYVNVMVGYSFQISFSALCAISQDLDISLRFSLKHCENVLQNALSAIFILKGKLKRLALPTYLVETIYIATLGISKKNSCWLQFFTTLGCGFGHLMGIDLWTGKQIVCVLILRIAVDFQPAAQVRAASTKI